MFHEHVWNKASALLFLKGRLYFHYVDGSKAKANAGGPSVLVAYGSTNVISLCESKIDGKIIIL